MKAKKQSPVMNILRPVKIMTALGLIGVMYLMTFRVLDEKQTVTVAYHGWNVKVVKNDLDIS